MSSPEKVLELLKVQIKHKIGPAQLAVVLLIPENNAKKIAEITQDKPANIHSAIRSLKQRGFIQSSPNPDNKRTRITQATDKKGKSLLKDIAKTFV